MSIAKIAISIDDSLLEKIDYFISQKKFKTRSQAIQLAVAKVINLLEHKRLAEECAKLDIEFERTLADVGLSEDVKEWPEF